MQRYKKIRLDVLSGLNILKDQFKKGNRIPIHQSLMLHKLRQETF